MICWCEHSAGGYAIFNFHKKRDGSIATLAADSALAGYHLLHSVRGDLLTKIGRFTEAREEIQRAITMTQNLREQELLTESLKQIEKAALSA